MINLTILVFSLIFPLKLYYVEMLTVLVMFMLLTVLYKYYNSLKSAESECIPSPLVHPVLIYFRDKMSMSNNIILWLEMPFAGGILIKYHVMRLSTTI